MAAGPTEVGRDGEAAVATFYERNGYTVLERNWRCRAGEIDLVCTRGHLLVICEVKSRSSDRFGSPLEAVSHAKRRRLRHLATLYLTAAAASNPAPSEAQSGRAGVPRGAVVRFDVASVLAGTVEVVEGAF